MVIVKSFLRKRRGDEEGLLLDRVKIKGCQEEAVLNGLTAWVRTRTVHEGQIFYILEIIYNRPINKGDVLYARLPSENLQFLSPSFSYKQDYLEWQNQNIK
jgi:hypothetical protein